MSECIGEECTHSSHRKLIGVDLSTQEDRSVLFDQQDPMSYDAVQERLDALREDNGVSTLKMPADDSPTKNVMEIKMSKKDLHRKMRSLGMGKHVAGNAKSLANHKRIPGEVIVGQTKTKAQYVAEQKKKTKSKNKMARKSRRKNRR